MTWCTHNTVLSSITGGGDLPVGLSGRMLAVSWWLFGFLIVSTYTANLAAFLTVSRLDTSISSLDDLAKQSDIKYSAIQDTASQEYFKRMKDIENRFYRWGFKRLVSYVSWHFPFPLRITSIKKVCGRLLSQPNLGLHDAQNHFILVFFPLFSNAYF